MLSRYALAMALTSGLLSYTAQAGDLRIVLPKRSTSTPVQQLNRDGVAAVKRHAVDKAKKLFYQAYLLDPDDPFTLNNLGYISELEGSLDRAQRFYALARGQSYQALVERSSRSSLRGKTIAEAAGTSDIEMQSNRTNLEAMRLLQQDRVLEADDELRRSLEIDPRNPFTLNNMGLIKEKEGDLQGALSNYRAAASLNSQEPVIVTTDPDARGRPITEVSERNARRVERRLPEQDALENKLARLNFLGVYAINHNNLEAAHGYFQQAVELSPGDAFALNNMGYLSEMDGDREAADSYYRNARTGKGAVARVTAATRHDAIGVKLERLARDNDDKVNAALAADLAAKRRHRGPIQLKRRDNTLVVEPPPPATPNQ
jgi:Flp pilus assembly protein TadD